MIDHKFLTEILDYDKDSCQLFYKKTHSTRGKGFILKGTLNKDGYLQTMFKGYNWKLHRLIYYFHTGKNPPIVDHIDGNKLNNSIENLRAATYCQNTYNSKTPSRSSTGVKGIRLHKGKYEVRVQAEGKRYNLGRYDSLDVAKECIEFARELAHGEFANHG